MSGCSDVQLQLCPVAVMTGCSDVQLQLCPVVTVSGCSDVKLQLCPVAVMSELHCIDHTTAVAGCCTKLTSPNDTNSSLSHLLSFSAEHFAFRFAIRKYKH